MPGTGTATAPTSRSTRTTTSARADNAQDWSAPQLLLERPGHILWYPSLQPMNTAEDIAAKRTTLRLGKRARLFVKDFESGSIETGGEVYCSDFVVEFER